MKKLRSTCAPRISTTEVKLISTVQRINVIHRNHNFWSADWCSFINLISRRNQCDECLVNNRLLLWNSKATGRVLTAALKKAFGQKEKKVWEGLSEASKLQRHFSITVRPVLNTGHFSDFFHLYFVMKSVGLRYLRKPSALHAAKYRGSYLILEKSYEFSKWNIYNIQTSKLKKEIINVACLKSRKRQTNNVKIF